MPITVAARRFTGYKYPPSSCADNHLSFHLSSSLRVLLSHSMLTTNGGQEMHHALKFSLYGGKFFT
jgi:hypothetical protein